MDSPTKQFGLMVAYLLPGFIGLAGIAPFAPVVAAWLHPLDQAQAGVGPPVYAVLAATTIGMIVSCFRWLIIDHIHRWTGIVPPVWDDSRLDRRLDGFSFLVENHYRYYQFVANTLISLVAAYSINRWIGTSEWFGVGSDIAFLLLCITLFAASRDALSKFYARTSRLVGRVAEKGPPGEVMYNGNDHQVQAHGPSAPPTDPNPDDRPSPRTEPVRDQPKPTKPVKKAQDAERH